MGAQLPVVIENECNARRSPKWDLEGGAGKDDHFAKNSAVDFLNPVRALLLRGNRNFSPKALSILLFNFENTLSFGGGLERGCSWGGERGLVLAEPRRGTARGGGRHAATTGEGCIASLRVAVGRAECRGAHNSPSLSTN